MFDALAANHRVIAFDRPGYGYSERPRGTVWTPVAASRPHPRRARAARRGAAGRGRPLVGHAGRARAGPRSPRRRRAPGAALGLLLSVAAPGRAAAGRARDPAARRPLALHRLTDRRPLDVAAAGEAAVRAGARPGALRAVPARDDAAAFAAARVGGRGAAHGAVGHAAASALRRAAPAGVDRRRQRRSHRQPVRPVEPARAPAPRAGRRSRRGRGPHGALLRARARRRSRDGAGPHRRPPTISPWSELRREREPPLARR